MYKYPTGGMLDPIPPGAFPHVNVSANMSSSSNSNRSDSHESQAFLGTLRALFNQNIPGLDDSLRRCMQSFGGSFEDFDATGQNITDVVQPYDSMSTLATHFARWEDEMCALSMQLQARLDARTQISLSHPVATSAEASQQFYDADPELDAMIEAEQDREKRRTLQNRRSQRRSTRRRELNEELLDERLQQVDAQLSEKENLSVNLQAQWDSMLELFELLVKVAEERGVKIDRSHPLLGSSALARLQHET